MKISSEEARVIFDTNNYVVFRNYTTPPARYLFDKAYEKRESVGDPFGGDYSSIKIMPKYFFENKDVNDFYNECLSMYDETNTYYIISGEKGSETGRHSDDADVIHQQCMGKSEWTMYEGLIESHQERQNIEKKMTKIILNAGDVIWFKKHQEHSVQNLEDKFSIIFMSNETLKNFITKWYNELGKEFI
jgi:hypothetical protein